MPLPVQNHAHALRPCLTAVCQRRAPDHEPLLAALPARSVPASPRCGDGAPQQCQGHMGEPLTGRRKPLVSRERSDAGAPGGRPVPAPEGPPAAGSRREAGADAGGSQVQRVVRQCYCCDRACFLPIRMAPSARTDLPSQLPASMPHGNAVCSRPSSPGLQRDDPTGAIPVQAFLQRHLLSAARHKSHVRHHRRTREQRR